MSCIYAERHHYPKQWVIEGSNDQINWDQLSDENECKELNGMCKDHRFIIKNKSNKKYRYIQMHTTCPNWNNSNYLTVDSIEFYGYLF